MCSGHYGEAIAHPYSLQQAMKIQAATPGKLRRLTDGLKSQHLAVRPAEGKWSIKEIITHLADTELVYSFRYRKILAEDTPDLSFFDQQLWAGNLSYHQRDLRSVLDMFKAVRQNNLDLMKLTPAKNWQRVGSHAEFGPLTFAQIVVHVVDHDLNHLKQIRQIRQTIRARG
jgi:uncharacterized damage-inducible protein DinB